MFSNVLSASIVGMDVCTVSVEADVSSGLPSFHMVGYASNQVKEAQERVRTALRNLGVSLPPKRIIVNLAPADVRKDGAGFDLPVAVAILAAIDKIPKKHLKDILVVGEVSLDGTVNGIQGVLPMVIHGKSQGISRVLFPKDNQKEARMVQGIKLIGVRNLEEVVRYFNDPATFPLSWEEQSEEENKEEEYLVDFADIRRQQTAKRAAEIAMSGFHNLLLVGPPGTGKSMLAKRLPTILPPLSREEQLELTKIYSIAGLLTKEQPFVRKRPFRSPHHTSSPQAIAGGGRNPKPGELTLAHHGILFLDEMPEFSRRSLEILRQPLEDKCICLSRVNGSYRFPANVLLVGAMNPCPCGYYPDLKRCTCDIRAVNQYLHRISQPLLDRMDLCVEVAEVSCQELMEPGPPEESSRQIRARVEAAHDRQRRRYAGTRIRFNGNLSSREIETYCQLSQKAKSLVEQILSANRMSMRGYHKILKVARTIADMENQEQIGENHIREAYGYRMLNKQEW